LSVGRYGYTFDFTRVISQKRANTTYCKTTKSYLRALISRPLCLNETHGRTNGAAQRIPSAESIAIILRTRAEKASRAHGRITLRGGRGRERGRREAAHPPPRDATPHWGPVTSKPPARSHATRGGETGSYVLGRGTGRPPAAISSRLAGSRAGRTGHADSPSRFCVSPLSPNGRWPPKGVAAVLNYSYKLLLS
jgi:hypothetical protein